MSEQPTVTIEQLEYAFVSWLTMYEAVETCRWMGLFTDERLALAGLQWQRFVKELGEVPAIVLEQPVDCSKLEPQAPAWNEYQAANQQTLQDIADFVTGKLEIDPPVTQDLTGRDRKA